MGKNAKDAVPALTQVLQNDQYPSVRANAAGTLKAIGTPEALKALKGYSVERWKSK